MSKKQIPLLLSLSLLPSFTWSLPCCPCSRSAALLPLPFSAAMPWAVTSSCQAAVCFTFYSALMQVDTATPHSLQANPIHVSWPRILRSQSVLIASINFILHQLLPCKVLSPLLDNLCVSGFWNTLPFLEIVPSFYSYSILWVSRALAPTSLA